MSDLILVHEEWTGASGVTKHECHSEKGLFE